MGYGRLRTGVLALVIATVLLVAELFGGPARVFAEDASGQAYGTGSVDGMTSSQDVAMSIVLDVSGSMDEGSALGGNSKLDSAKKQSIDFVTSTIRHEAVQNGLSARVGVVSFSGDALIECDLSNDSDVVANAIGSLTTRDMTNIYAGLETGVAQLQAAEGERIMVLLSDGLSNMGPDDAAIRLLAEQARDMGITIYTIGFGPSGSIDESLLVDIAQITGGSYAHEDPSNVSSAAVGLFATLLNAQLTAAHLEILGEATGSVAQGETTEVGSFDVRTNGQLVTYLYWPGSLLDLKLIDPDGIEVDVNYPSSTIDATVIPSKVTIGNAKVGTWRLSVYGRETSMNKEPFYVVAALDKMVQQMQVGPSSGGGTAPNHGEGLLFLLLAIAAASITGVAAFSMRRN